MIGPYCNNCRGAGPCYAARDCVNRRAQNPLVGAIPDHRLPPRDDAQKRKDAIVAARKEGMRISDLRIAFDADTRELQAILADAGVK